ncbi:hypothetical protein HYX58_06000 [Candidatus Dependentiae bacterium]|nr:hypothetical protein [Candidatus Dependentiae bacterium]
MKINLFKLSFIALLCATAPKICSTQLTITRPGFYQLGEDFLVSPTANGDAVIRVASSDVTIDFNGHFISQLNTTQNIAGVFINPALNDIVIQNGLIQNISGTGIVVTASDMRIEIINMTFTNCSAAALVADGTSGTINNLEIRSCIMSGCCSNGTDRNVVLLSRCNRSRMLDCVLDNTVNTLIGINTQTTQFAMLSLASCSMCTFKNIWIQNNFFRAFGATGQIPNVSLIQESGDNNCEFDFVLIRNNQCFNTGTLGANNRFNGFAAPSVCDSNRYVNCQIVSNVMANSQSQDMNGFFGIWTNSIFDRCFIVSCSATNNLGLNGLRTINGSNANVFNGCCAIGNSSFPITGATDGFNCPDTNSLFKSCIAAYNTSSVNTSLGFNLPQTPAHVVLYENIAHRNQGPTNAGSIGFSFSGTRASLVTRNIAYNNGTIAANQFVNVNSGSQIQITSDLIQTVTAPWSNLAISQ